MFVAIRIIIIILFLEKLTTFFAIFINADQQFALLAQSPVLHFGYEDTVKFMLPMEG
jgi:hypothetical protein